jgi:putative transposase
VGYAIDEYITAELCIAALQMALLRRKPKAGLILHSDHGSQYCAKAYQFQLSKAGIVASMMPQKVTVMIMRLWRVSGVHSKMN